MEHDPTAALAPETVTSYSDPTVEVARQLEATYLCSRIIPQLTRREREVASLLAMGMTLCDISATMDVSRSAVKTYLVRIRKRSANLKPGLEEL